MYAGWRSVNTVSMMKLAAVGIITLLILTWAMHRSTSLASPPAHSWWYRNRRRTITVSVLIASGAALTIALMNNCRYPCQQWQSTGLDLLATIGGFWLGMIIARAVDPQTESQIDWAQVSLWMTGLLLVTTGLLVITGLVFSPLANATPNSLVIFIWALGLPILGAAAKRRWPWLF